MGAGWQLTIVIDIFTQQLQKLFLVLTNKLGKLRVSCTDLLKDRLKHLGLLLYELSQLLKVRVVAQKFEIAQSFPRRSSRSSRSGTTSATTLSGLGSSFEEVNWLLRVRIRSRLGSRRR